MARGVRGQEIVAALAEDGVEFFTVDDLVERFGIGRVAARDLAHRLAKANQARRIKRNLYAFLEPAYWGRPDAGPTFDWYRAAARLAEPDPYFLAYYTAMELHGMLQHPLQTVFVATIRQRPPVVVPPLRIRFVTLTERKFFGSEKKPTNPALGLEVADLERTAIDCVDRMDLCGGLEEAVRGLARRHEDLDRDRLVRYLMRLEQPVVTKRLGFLLEAVGHDDPDLLWQMQELGGRLKHYVPLVNGRPMKGARKDPRWELLVNETIERLVGARFT